jgi:transcriptional regulator with GAF, ATPase, and Fis domain
VPDSGFIDLVAAVSTRLAGLAASQVGAEIDSALDSILGYLGTDRIMLLELRNEGASIFVAHSRIRSGAEGVPPVLGQDAARTWYAPKLRAGDVVRLDRVPDDLPAAAREERDHAVRFASRSHLAVPLSITGRWVCALATDTCLDDRSWSDETVQELRVLGQILANELHRATLETELRERLAQLHRLENRLRAENEYLREEIDIEAGFESIVGRSSALRHVRELAVQVAETPASVLLLGETGTGKDLIGRAIHSRSSRRERAFIRVNCAALPPSLVESELFGYEKGAFTGATSSKPGRFELADEGTLFLDEIGELPGEVQAKLLRVLQDGEFERLGAVQTRKVDVRIIAATNRDLTAAMSLGRFREDLFYRIAAFPIHMPPLRDRPEDIPLLVWDFVHRRGPELGRCIERIPEAAMTALCRYSWPGNVRELGNVIERALILSKGPELCIDEAFAGAARVKPSGLDLAGIERKHIVRVLERCHWKINGRGNAAEVLGLHPNTLRGRLQKLGIERPAVAPNA